MIRAEIDPKHTYMIQDFVSDGLYLMIKILYFHRIYTKCYINMKYMYAIFLNTV
jgi:hypothetical protein